MNICSSPTENYQLFGSVYHMHMWFVGHKGSMTNLDFQTVWQKTKKRGRRGMYRDHLDVQIKSLHGVTLVILVYQTLNQYLSMMGSLNLFTQGGTLKIISRSFKTNSLGGGGGGQWEQCPLHWWPVGKNAPLTAVVRMLALKLCRHHQIGDPSPTALGAPIGGTPMLKRALFEKDGSMKTRLTLEPTRRSTL